MLYRVFLGIALLLAVPVSASALEPSRHDPRGVWQQVQSSAGACDACTLRITAEGANYVVEASNGWNARVAFSHQGLLVGAGVWDRAAPRMDPSKKLNIQMVVKDHIMVVLMQLRRPDGTDWYIKAAFTLQEAGVEPDLNDAI